MGELLMLFFEDLRSDRKEENGCILFVIDEIYRVYFKIQSVSMTKRFLVNFTFLSKLSISFE